jgi:hypothetical protein
MDTIMILNISILVIVVLGILVAYKAGKRPGKGKAGWKAGKAQKPKDVNHEAFFILGISFIPLGLIFSAAIGNPGFMGLTALGVIYIAIGLSNRDKGRLASARKKMTYAEDIGGLGGVGDIGSAGDSEPVKMPNRLKAPAIMKAKNRPGGKGKAKRKASVSKSKNKKRKK